MSTWRREARELGEDSIGRPKDSDPGWGGNSQGYDEMSLRLRPNPMAARRFDSKWWQSNSATGSYCVKNKLLSKEIDDLFECSPCYDVLYKLARNDFWFAFLGFILASIASLVDLLW